MTLNKLFKTELKLTETEKEVESLIVSLLSKKDTVIEDDLAEMSYLVSNENLRYYIDVKNIVKIAAQSNAMHLQFRLNVIEHFKKLIEEESARRLKEKRTIIFNNTLGVLGEMNNKLKN